MPLSSPTAAHQSVSCLVACHHIWFTNKRGTSSVVEAQQQQDYTSTGFRCIHLPKASGPAVRGSQQQHRSAAAAAVSPPAPVLAQRKPRLAIFVSGGGSNFRSIHAGVLEGHISAEVAVVISDVPGCGGWEYAAARGIPTEVYPPAAQADGRHQPLTTETLVTALKERYEVDYVLLAGYLKLIPAELVRAYPRAMLNIHPALLPAFGGKGYYGSRVHKAVIASGARFSGPTIHFVDDGYDTGPILAQAVVPVSPTDTPKQLAARVLREEHRLYPQAVAALVDGRVNWRADGIPVLWTAQ